MFILWEIFHISITQLKDVLSFFTIDFMITEKLEDIDEMIWSRKIFDADDKLYSENHLIWWNQMETFYMA